MGAFIISLWQLTWGGIYMSKTINCVIDTQNKKEREELIDYLTTDNVTLSTIDDCDGFQLVVVSDFGVGYIGVIVANNLVNKENYAHFKSVDEYITACEGK